MDTTSRSCSDIGLAIEKNDISGLLGESATIITLIGGLLYGGGAIAFGVRLWIRQLPATNIVSLIPRNLLITTALAAIVVPTIAAGLTMALVFRTVKPRTWRRQLGYLGCAAAVSLIVAATTYLLTSRVVHHLRVGVAHAHAATVLSIGSFGITLAALILVAGVLAQLHGQTFWLATLAFAVALTPGIAIAAGGAARLPFVRVCNLSTVEGGELTGNLIAVNGNDVYLAAFEPVSPERVRYRGIRIVTRTDGASVAISSDDGGHIRCPSPLASAITSTTTSSSEPPAP